MSCRKALRPLRLQENLTDENLYISQFRDVANSNSGACILLSARSKKKQNSRLDPTIVLPVVLDTSPRKSYRSASNRHSGSTPRSCRSGDHGGGGEAIDCRLMGIAIPVPGVALKIPRQMKIDRVRRCAEFAVDLHLSGYF